MLQVKLIPGLWNENIKYMLYEHCLLDYSLNKIDFEDDLA